VGLTESGEERGKGRVIHDCKGEKTSSCRSRKSCSTRKKKITGKSGSRGGEDGLCKRLVGLLAKLSGKTYLGKGGEYRDDEMTKVLDPYSPGLATREEKSEAFSAGGRGPR